MKLQHKLSLGLITLLVVVTTITYLSTSATQESRKAFRQLSQQTLPVLEELQELRFNSMRLLASTLQYGLLDTLAAERLAAQRPTPEAELEQKRAEIADADAHLKHALERYMRVIKTNFPDEVDVAVRIQGEVLSLQSAGRGFIQAVHSEASDDEVDAIKAKMEAAMHSLLVDYQTAIDGEHEEIEEREERLESAIQSQLEHALFGAGGLLAVTIFLFLSLRKHLLRPIKQIQSQVAGITHGNFDAAFETVKSGELAELQRSIDEMSVKFQQTIEQVQHTADYTNKILAVMADSVITFDATGHIKSANPAACQLLEYNRQELLGKPVATILETRDPSIDPVEYFDPDSGNRTEHRLLTRTGRLVDAQTMATSLRDQNNQVSGYLCISFSPKQAG